jgi:hypothetical protein
VDEQLNSGVARQLLRNSMEYWYFLMYKALSVLRRSREYKKRRELSFGAHAAGISHRRGSWLACRREMLLNRQNFVPRSSTDGASDVLVLHIRFVESTDNHS